MYITRAELETCFKSIGMSIAPDQSEALMIDNDCLETDYLNVEDFYSKLDCWKEVSAAVEPVRKPSNHEEDKLQDEL